MIGIRDFRILPDESEEIALPGLSPEETVCMIALQKAKNVSRFCGVDDIIIAADTLVFLDGFLLGKPESPDDAGRMLMALSGRSHTVFTGLVLMRGVVSATGVEKTDVYFRELSDDEIYAYVNTGEPMDKAGAYAAQGRAAVFIERIEGDFFNVMGLPLCRLSVMLREYGVTL